MMQHFVDDRSAWSLLLTACPVTELGTSVICYAVLILCLGSFLLQDVLGSKYSWLSRDRDLMELHRS